MTNETLITNARYNVVIVNREGVIDNVHCMDINAIRGIRCDFDRAQRAFAQGDTIALAYDHTTNNRFFLREVDW